MAPSRTRTPSAGRGVSRHHDQNRHGSSANDGSMLLDLIERQQFDKVIARIKARPSEAKMILSGNSGAHNSVMNQGNLALHEACKNQPTMELIDVLLEANEDAIRTKGQWGYLPLHFACASRASPEVVAKLIVVHPSATRAMDDHEGTLPLHLAAKWGSAEEVIMALLMVHPNASATNDSSGKSPIDHARLLSSPLVREPVVAALLRAPILCTVSQAAMSNMTHESDSKLREVVEVYQERMTQVKDRYEQEKTKAVALEVQLRKELWDAKERASTLSDKSAHLSALLEKREEDLKAKDQILQQIQGLLSSSKNQHPDDTNVQMYNLDQRSEQRASGIRQRRDFLEQQRESRDEKETRRDISELDTTANREWFSPDSSGTGPSPSPRAAAVATVKEWFSSETRQLSNDSDIENDIKQSGGGVGVGDDAVRDKVESYRQGHPQRGWMANHKDFAKKHSRQEKKKNNARDRSLLNRSKSVPRANSLLKKRESVSNRQIPTQDMSGSGRRNVMETNATNSEGQVADPSQNYSYSTSSSRMTQNTANTSEWRRAQTQSALRRSRDFNNHSPTRPRDGGYVSNHQKKSLQPVSTHVYLNNRGGYDDLDDGDSLTMDSQMVDWE